MVSGRLGGGARVLGQHRCALVVTRVRQRERERRPQQDGFRGCGSGAGEREASFAGAERGVEIEFFGREKAERPEQLDPQVDRRVLGRGRERKLEEAAPLGDTFREREVPAQRCPEPDRDAAARGRCEHM